MIKLCTWTCMYVRVCKYMYVCTCMYVHVCMYMYVCTCMYVHVCMCMYVCACMYVHVCMCMYVYVYVYIHTYIHTYTHTYVHSCMHLVLPDTAADLIRSRKPYKYMPCSLIIENPNSWSSVSEHSCWPLRVLKAWTSTVWQLYS